MTKKRLTTLALTLLALLLLCGTTWAAECTDTEHTKVVVSEVSYEPPVDAGGYSLYAWFHCDADCGADWGDDYSCEVPLAQMSYIGLIDEQHMYGYSTTVTSGGQQVSVTWRVQGPAPAGGGTGGGEGGGGDDGDSGSVIYPPCEHEPVFAYQAPTCTESGFSGPNYCRKCLLPLSNYVHIDPLEHELVLRSEGKAETCQEDGVTALYACERCNHTEGGETIPATGKHTLGTEPITPAVAATHTTPGSTAVYQCVNCPYTEGGEETPALQDLHNMGTEPFAQGEDPTCTMPGMTPMYRCVECEAYFIGGEEIPALGHTSIEDGIPQERIEPTCTDRGREAGVLCGREGCGHWLEGGGSLPHAYHEYDVANPIPETPPTCTEDGKGEGYPCLNCDFVEYKLGQPALGHDSVEKDRLESTCTVHGHEAGVWCNRCETWLSGGEELKLDNHIFNSGNATSPWVDPTCTTPGKSPDHPCTYGCGYIFCVFPEIPALGHDWVEFDRVEPTCTLAGKIAYRFCNRCHVYQELDGTIIPDGIQSIFIPSPGHDYSAHGIYRDPTCILEGCVNGIACHVCGDVLRADEIIPATGHNPGGAPVKAAVPPTCLEPSQPPLYKCQNPGCNEVVPGNEPIEPATGHIWGGEVEPYIPPTCTEPGRWAVNQCAVCGELFGGGEVPPQHTNKYIFAIPVTCLTDGKTEGYDCAVCDAYLSGQEIIKAPGQHTLVLTHTDEPNCTEPIYETWTCKNPDVPDCDYFEARLIQTAGDAHTFGDWLPVPGMPLKISLAPSGTNNDGSVRFAIDDDAVRTADDAAANAEETFPTRSVLSAPQSTSGYFHHARQCAVCGQAEVEICKGGTRFLMEGYPGTCDACGRVHQTYNSPRYSLSGLNPGQTQDVVLDLGKTVADDELLVFQSQTSEVTAEDAVSIIGAATAESALFSVDTFNLYEVPNNSAKFKVEVDAPENARPQITPDFIRVIAGNAKVHTDDFENGVCTITDLRNELAYMQLCYDAALNGTDQSQEMQLRLSQLQTAIETLQTYLAGYPTNEFLQADEYIASVNGVIVYLNTEDTAGHAKYTGPVIVTDRDGDMVQIRTLNGLYWVRFEDLAPISQQDDSHLRMTLIASGASSALVDQMLSTPTDDKSLQRNIISMHLTEQGVTSELARDLTDTLMGVIDWWAQENETFPTATVYAGREPLNPVDFTNTDLTDFADADDINPVNQAALNILNELGLTQPLADSANCFDPDEPVSNGAVAQLVYLVMNGGNADHVADYADTDSFDVTGDSANIAFIKYFLKQGVFTPDEHGSFDATQPVTGYELVKTLLVASGYNAERHGLNGAHWQANAATLMAQSGMDLPSVNLDDPLTTQDACAIIASALNMKMPQYEGNELILDTTTLLERSFNTTMTELTRELNSQAQQKAQKDLDQKELEAQQKADESSPNSDNPDADGTNNDAAENLMTAALGIDSKGAYNPSAAMTRADATKMLTYLTLGGKQPTAVWTDPIFNDLDAATVWEQSSIEYCVNLGLITGTGDGGFNPTGGLSGYQFAKMLLVALGYDRAHEGFTGDQWQLNVTLKALETGLFNHVDMNALDQLSREDACTMAFNALQAPMVAYRTQLFTDADGQVTERPVAQRKDTTLLGTAFDITLEEFQRMILDANQIKLSASPEQPSATASDDTTIPTADLTAVPPALAATIIKANTSDEGTINKAVVAAAVAGSAGNDSLWHVETSNLQERSFPFQEESSQRFIVTKATLDKEEQAFSGCTRLKTFTVENALSESKQTALKVPEKKVNTYQHLFMREGLSKNVTITATDSSTPASDATTLTSYELNRDANGTFTLTIDRELTFLVNDDTMLTIQGVEADENGQATLLLETLTNAAE